MLNLFPFEVVVEVPMVAETVKPGERPAAAARRLAREKMREVVRRRGDDAPVLAADTVVVLGEEILGKPRDEADARRMLRLLSGRVHRVITGVAIRWRGKEQIVSVSSRVVFRDLSEREIADYVASGEPSDKAGAYAVQGLGGALVSAVHGSVSNVIGLPIGEVVEALRALGFLRGLAPAPERRAGRRRR